jgi:hypothetical protein
MVSYLSYPADVFVSALLVETEILVQSESYVVAIKAVGCKPKVKEMLLECGRNGGFSGRAEACEPDCEAALLSECVTLAAREGRVPGNVAVIQVSISRSIDIWWGMEGFTSPL